MSLVRAALFGALIAVGFPMLVKNVGGQFGDFVSRSSMHFQLFDTWVRFNLPIFLIVTVLTFGFLQIWRK